MTLTTLPQNEILVQIITALGGTVRDAHKRNWLLEDWRDLIASFTGIGDIVDFDFAVSAYQPIKAASLALPAVNYRATDGSTGSLGFVDSQFDSAGHDTASGVKPTESLTINFDLAGGSHTATTITDGSAAAVSSSFSQVEDASVTEEVSISKIKLAKLASGSNTVSVRVVYELSGTEYTDAYVIVDLFDGSFISTSAFGGLVKEACDVIDTGDGYYQVCVACTKKPTATRRRLYVSPAWASSVTTVSDSTLQGTVTYKDVENVGYDNGLLYVTALLDQEGSNNAVQGTAINQPLIDRYGTTDLRQTNTWLESESLSPTTKISGVVSIRAQNLALLDYGLLAQDTITGERMFSFSHKKGGLGKLEFSIFSSTAYKPVTCTMLSTDYENRAVFCGFSYDSVTGTKLYIDGIPQVTTGVASGTIDSGTAKLIIGALSSNFWKLDGQINTSCVSLETLSDAAHLDIYNQYIENQKIDLFIKGGQSNMVGNPTDTATVPAPLIPTDEGYFFDGAAKLPYVAPQGLELDGSACEAFCNEYFAQTGRRAMIIEGAYNGSAMTSEGGGVSNWEVSSAAYTTFLANGLEAERITGLKIKGVLWAQGESDSYNITSGPNTTDQTIYTAGFNDLLDRIDTNFPTAQVFISKLGNYTLPQSLISDTMIRTVQDQMASERANVHIAFDGAVNFDSGVHYKQSEYNIMGTAMGLKASQEIE